MLTRFDSTSTRLMVIRIFGLSLVFTNWTDSKRVFNNLSIIMNESFISIHEFKSVNFGFMHLNQTVTTVF